MAGDKIRYLTIRPGANGVARYFWQPKTSLQKQGWAARRVPPSWEAYDNPSTLRTAAEAEAEMLNTELDRWRGVTPQVAAGVPLMRFYVNGARIARPDGRLGLYVIIRRDGKLKIGISRDARQRLQRMQTDSPDRIWLLLFKLYPDKDAAALEKRVHTLMKAKRVRGEWFTTHFPDALALLDRAEQELRTEQNRAKV